MEKFNKKNMDFVLHYYEAGKLDTQKAIRHFKKRPAIVETVCTPSQPHRSTWRYASIAATLMILVVAGALLLFHKDATTLTADSAIKTYMLPDHSRVTLAPHSTLSFTGDDCRDVSMTGKVYFEVKHDAVHPFDINGDMSHVRVLGTKFMVSERAASSEVYVTNGKVLFTAKSESEGIILTKGMRAKLAKGSMKPQLAESGSVNQTAWATHKFHFDNTPVSEVLNVLSDYYNVHLSTNDTGKHLSGDFDATDLNDITDVIEETLNIKIERK